MPIYCSSVRSTKDRMLHPLEQSNKYNIRFDHRHQNAKVEKFWHNVQYFLGGNENVACDVRQSVALQSLVFRSLLKWPKKLEPKFNSWTRLICHQDWTMNSNYYNFAKKLYFSYSAKSTTTFYSGLMNTLKFWTALRTRELQLLSRDAALLILFLSYT